MAIEIKVREKYTRHNVKRQKSTSSASGPVGGKKNRATNGMSALVREQAKKDAVEQTTRNRMILVILPSGKRRFMRLSEYVAAGSAGG